MQPFRKEDLPKEIEEVATQVVDSIYAVYSQMGPGLLESIYESCLVKEFQRRGIRFERQKSLKIFYRGEALDENFRLDLLVDGKVVVEIKSVEALMPIHEAQVLTYLKLSECQLGLLVNFNTKYLKENLKRVILSKKD